VTEVFEAISDLNGQTLSSSVPALATIVLAILTWVLARATKAMANATSQAQIVASLEPNSWSINHFDIVVENAGTAPAYDVEMHLILQCLLVDHERANHFLSRTLA